MRRTLGLIGLLVVLMVCGCESPAGEIELGVVRDGTFHLLTDGDELPLGPMQNGGYLSTPMVRFLGLECDEKWGDRTACTTEASLVSSLGEQVASVMTGFPYTLVTRDDDEWQSGYVPIAIHEVEMIDALYGQLVTLEMSLLGAGGQTLSITMTVQLVDGRTEPLGPGT